MQDFKDSLFDMVLANKVLPKRKDDCHKNDFGTVGIMGGSVNYSGAVKLANLSLCELVCGAGISRLIIPDVILNGVLPYIVESTLMPIDSNGGSIKFDKTNINNAIKGLTALSVGMGMTNNSDTYKIIEFLIKNFKGNLLIDADGLNALSSNVDLLLDKSCNIVLTPHLGEFSRLIGVSKELIIKNPLKYAKNFAKKYNVILLLKGAVTTVTDGDAFYYINSGVSGQATAGSGDVLSGIIGGLLGFMPFDIKTISLGGFISGLAGSLAQKECSPISLTSSKTIEFIRDAVSKIYNYES